MRMGGGRIEAAARAATPMRPADDPPARDKEMEPCV